MLVSKLEVRFPLPSAVNLIKALLLLLGTPAKSPNISEALLAVKSTTPEPLVVILRYFTASLPSISKCCATEGLVI